ncbi:MAG: hypothetical protein MR224_02640 [Dorea sp.]|nr:hypothetical protein [Dorea sp.]MDY2814883.1 hypothetical protein [Dorea sp.]
MYENCHAELKMHRMILQDSFFDKTIYQCRVITYREEEECLYLLAEEAELTAFSLDGIYECEIVDEESKVVCSGMIQERYWNKLGKVMKFQIQRGFYKKLLN